MARPYRGLDDFSDNAEIVNKDAVAVTSAIGLFDGYEDGHIFHAVIHVQPRIKLCVNLAAHRITL